eukprot:TRINITY_DN7132_c0_g1_i1.p1 TRINITY_DN7132_c0_g1~~TRINITY_DN7132_c0_g1_i1.p1  ORF type:complete len:530 (+),score=56.76 TRINITY_DN7132_c0_g1_i1:115-1704(+)
MLRRMQQNSGGFDSPKTFLGTPIKTIWCNNQFMVLTSIGYVHRIGTDLASQLSTGNTIRVLNVQNGTSDIDTAIDIACTNYYPAPAYAVTSSGMLYSWGDVSGAIPNSVSPAMLGNRGLETDPNVVAPVSLPAGSFAVKLAVSRSTVFVLLADGNFVPLGYCGIWCLNASTVTFPNVDDPNSIVVGIPGESIVDLSVTHDALQGYSEAWTSHSIFCTASGRVYTAGFAAANVLLVSSAADTHIPQLVTSVGSALFCKKVFATRYASFILMRDGSIWSGGAATSNGFYTSKQEADKLNFALNPITDPDIGIPLNPFVASDFFPLTPDRVNTGFLVPGRHGAKQVIQGWGESNEVSFWLPYGGPTYLPNDISYITADTGGSVSHCTGGTDPYPLAICTTTTGKILVWGQKIVNIDFPGRYGLDNPEVNTTIPTPGDIRQTIPVLDVSAIFDENPFPNGMLVVQYPPAYYPNGAFGFLASGQALPQSRSKGVPLMVNFVSVSCMIAHTVIVTQDGKTYFAQLNDNEMTEFVR